MQFEFDPEVLIEEIKSRPGMWDNEDVLHRSKEAKMRLWNEVVDVLLQDQHVSKSEKRELELQLQKKWKGLRDAFLKYLNNPTRHRRPYIYAKQLQFLLKNRPHVQRRGEEQDEAGNSDSNGAPRTEWKPKRRLKIVKKEQPESSDDDIDPTPQYLEEEDDRPVTKMVKPNRSYVNEFAFANVDVSTSSTLASASETHDGDKMFLLSLLPHLKSIPEEFRLTAKMELLQVLQTANYSSAGNLDHK